MLAQKQIGVASEFYVSADVHNGLNFVTVASLSPPVSYELYDLCGAELLRLLCDRHARVCAMF